MAKLKYYLFEVEAQDAENLCRLVNSAYRGESSKVGWTTEADLLGGQRTDPESLQKDLLKPQQKILMLTEDSDKTRLCACVFLKKLDSEIAYLGMLTVKPQMQAAGIGREMLSHAEDFAQSWGCLKMRMTVIAQRSELISWYERRGYHKTGEREEFPYGDEKFGIPRREDLFFWVLEKKL